MAHNNKQFMKVVSWAQKHMKCEISETKVGLRITPTVKNVRAWTCRPEDKGMYDFMRYLAKVAGVSKRDIETAVKLDIPLKTNES